MSADQVDEVARAEGRGKNANVADPRPRCPWCFLKGGTKGNHFCRWRPPTDDRAVGGPVRQVPQYARRRKK